MALNKVKVIGKVLYKRRESRGEMEVTRLINFDNLVIFKVKIINIHFSIFFVHFLRKEVTKLALKTDMN